MRDKRIDFVKGICILLMVWGHLPRMGTFHEALECAVRWIYSFHVPIFVLISGYLFGTKLGSVGEMQLVIKRMFKPYFVMSIVMTVLYWIAARCGLQTSAEKPWGNYWSLLYEIIVGRGGGALWYLHTVGIIELIVLMCLWIGRKVQKLSPHVWIVICLGVGCAMSYMSKFDYCVGANFSVFFLIGYFIRRGNVALPNFWACGLFAVVCIFTLDSEFQYTKIFWVMSVFGVLMALSERSFGTRYGRCIQFFGEHTMSLLLFHSVFAVAYRPISPMILRAERTGVGLNIIMFLLVISSCVILEWVVSKMKIIKLIW